MYSCPQCGDSLANDAVICNGCRWVPGGAAKGAKAPIGPSEKSLRAVEARSLSAPTSFDLTPQQWYNVCKFNPTLAERCKRPRPSVGPDHPLDATAQLGPMLRGLRFQRMREPGEEG